MTTPECGRDDGGVPPVPSFMQRVIWIVLQFVLVLLPAAWRMIWHWCVLVVGYVALGLLWSTGTPTAAPSPISSGVARLRSIVLQTVPLHVLPQWVFQRWLLWPHVAIDCTMVAQKHRRFLKRGVYALDMVDMVTDDEIVTTTHGPSHLVYGVPGVIIRVLMASCAHTVVLVGSHPGKHDDACQSTHEVVVGALQLDGWHVVRHTRTVRPDDEGRTKKVMQCGTFFDNSNGTEQEKGDKGSDTACTAVKGRCYTEYVMERDAEWPVHDDAPTVCRVISICGKSCAKDELAKYLYEFGHHRPTCAAESGASIVSMATELLKGHHAQLPYPPPDTMVACALQTSVSTMDQAALYGATVIPSAPSIVGRTSDQDNQAAQEGRAHAKQSLRACAMVRGVSPLALRDCEFRILPRAQRVTYAHVLGLVEAELETERRRGR